LRDVHRLRVLKSRVLRTIFGPKRNDVTGKWRRLHNAELYDVNLRQTSDIILVTEPNTIISDGHMAHMGERALHKSFW
jgi:hypothetical protein